LAEQAGVPDYSYVPPFPSLPLSLTLFSFLTPPYKLPLYNFFLFSDPMNKSPQLPPPLSVVASSGLGAPNQLFCKLAFVDSFPVPPVSPPPIFFCATSRLFQGFREPWCSLAGKPRFRAHPSFSFHLVFATFARSPPLTTREGFGLTITCPPPLNARG